MDGRNGKIGGMRVCLFFLWRIRKEKNKKEKNKLNLIKKTKKKHKTKLRIKVSVRKKIKFAKLNTIGTKKKTIQTKRLLLTYWFGT